MNNLFLDITQEMSKLEEENRQLKLDLYYARRLKDDYKRQLQSEIDYRHRYISALDSGVFKWLDGGDKEYFIPNELDADEINTLEEWGNQVENNEDLMGDYDEFINL